MTLFLCIFLCLSFVIAEKCVDNNNTAISNFVCGKERVSEAFLRGCRPGDEIGCRHSFLYQNDQWKKSVEPIIYKTGDQECQNISNVNFSVRCSERNCEVRIDDKERKMDGFIANDAALYCFNSTVEVICDGKIMASKLTQNNSTLSCVLGVESSEDGPLKRSVSTRTNGKTCDYNRTGGEMKVVEYQCSKGDNCEKPFNNSLILKKCQVKVFQCGKKQYLRNLKSYPSFCIYLWNRDGKSYKLEENYPLLRVDNLTKCISIDYEHILIACKEDSEIPNKCVNLSFKQGMEYCGDKIEENRKRRLVVTVGFSIFSFLFIIATVYGSICTFRKAGKAHSTLLHEYQLEFGSNPMTTSGSKKEKKRKRKEVNGGKGKKVKRDPPF